MGVKALGSETLAVFILLEHCICFIKKGIQERTTQTGRIQRNLEILLGRLEEQKMINLEKAPRSSQTF